MPAVDQQLTFMLAGKQRSFRAVKRKGELRYIASHAKGSLKALSCFAAPTKRVPRLYLKLMGLFDFKIPGAAEAIGISESFLEQAAAALDTVPERVGMYVGEPTSRRKLVVIDTGKESSWVLKIAAGTDADQAILNERNSLELFSGSPDSAASAAVVRDIFFDSISIPKIQAVPPVCGREALLVERIRGRQLTPREFETFFFKNGGFKQQVSGFKREEEFPRRGAALPETVGEWIERSGVRAAGRLSPLIAACRECGALDLRSHTGVVHGDFAPWNVIQRTPASCPLSGRLKSQTGDSRMLSLIDWEFCRSSIPQIFDSAYACWCFAELLDQQISWIDKTLWYRLVALGALWKELREILIK
ncbi:MAG: phosphotransferase [Kiritimatiellales bacterium]